MNIRPFDPTTDLAKLLALCEAIEQYDQTHEPVTEEELRAEDGKLRWVVESSHQMIGHGWLLQNPARAYMLVAVHPDHRRCGVGTALLKQVTQACPALGIHQLIAFLPITGKPAAEGFLRRFGFELAGQNRHFSAPVRLPDENPQWPTGFTVKTYAEVNQIEVLAEAFNRCYGDRWGHHENREPLTVEQLQKYMMDYPNAFLPDGMVLVFAPNGDIAATVSGRLYPPSPTSQGQMRRVIDSPGVVPAYRGLGLQRALVLRALQWCATQPDGPIELATYGDTEDEAALYRAMGFTLEPYNHWLEYTLQLNID